jgi:hypothetical protein
MWSRLIAKKAKNGINSHNSQKMLRKLIEIHDEVVRLAKQSESGNE